MDSWIQGGFNVCVMVEVGPGDSSTRRRLVLRCPMPHKLAEQQHPGTVDEKVNCEVATYIWMDKHCSQIRIPGLFAFGFRNGPHFTHVKHRGVFARIYYAFRKWIYRISHRDLLLSDFTRNPAAPPLGFAYVLLEYIGPETGQMLSLTWQKHLHDSEQRDRLYRGISRIMLSLARLPQARIGSFRFNASDGSVALSNRPLTCAMAIFENGGTTRVIEPLQTYQSADSFASDMLTLHDNHLLHDAHGVRDEDDARERMTIRTLLRAVAHRFILPSQRDGPFLCR